MICVLKLTINGQNLNWCENIGEFKFNSKF